MDITKYQPLVYGHYTGKILPNTRVKIADRNIRTSADVTYENDTGEFSDCEKKQQLM